MNVVPQYKVIGPYNYNRIIHNKKNYAKRQDIGQTSGKIHLILKTTIKFQYSARSIIAMTLK